MEASTLPRLLPLAVVRGAGLPVVSLGFLGFVVQQNTELRKLINPDVFCVDLSPIDSFSSSSIGSPLASAF